MAVYYVNKNAQDNGDHEVHKSDCSRMPNEENRKYLGTFINCVEAVREAKKYYLRSNGCYYCSNECHIKEELQMAFEKMDDKSAWERIEREFGINKITFAKKINFVKGKFKREIIFRDVKDAYILSNSEYEKPALVLAGGVIEELLRIYLEHRGKKSPKNTFNSYIETCEKEHLLKSSINSLGDVVRQFRNIVHLANEESETHTISKANAKNAVSSIFIIANDF